MLATFEWNGKIRSFSVRVVMERTRFRAKDHIDGVEQIYQNSQTC
jgi:hypothetical protein